MQRAPHLATQFLALCGLFLALTQVVDAKPAALPKPKTTAANHSATHHTVYQGQTLGMIAKRYNVSVEDLCSANAISRRTPIKPGQKLVLPGAPVGPARIPSPTTASPAEPGRTNPSNVSSLRQTQPGSPTRALTSSSTSSAPTWKKYVRPARRAGYVTLRATGRRWEGYAVVKGNRLAAAALLGFKRALYSWRTGAEAPVDQRLIRLLVKVSDTFGGRPLRIVSGFRENSFSKASKHKRGQACDLSVEGVPNEALRDYLLTLDQVGVGFYPNSSFVHLDVRPVSNQWVDRSSPGERPEYDHDDD